MRSLRSRICWRVIGASPASTRSFSCPAAAFARAGWSSRDPPRHGLQARENDSLVRAAGLQPDTLFPSGKFFGCAPRPRARQSGSRARSKVRAPARARKLCGTKKLALSRLSVATEQRHTPSTRSLQQSHKGSQSRLMLWWRGDGPVMMD
jgi:hypothetical protein